MVCFAWVVCDDFCLYLFNSVAGLLDVMVCYLLNTLVAVGFLYFDLSGWLLIWVWVFVFYAVWFGVVVVFACFRILICWMVVLIALVAGCLIIIVYDCLFLFWVRLCWFSLCCLIRLIIACLVVVLLMLDCCLGCLFGECLCLLFDLIMLLRSFIALCCLVLNAVVFVFGLLFGFVWLYFVGLVYLRNNW